jgi:phosphatidylglycerophosphate synthase
MAGKLKMVFQCASAIISLLLLSRPPESASPWLVGLAWIAAWVAVISTVYSGIGYILTAIRLVRSS